MDHLLDAALRRAFLHDDPLAFEAGVRAAFRVLSEAGLLGGGVDATASEGRVARVA